MHKNAIPVQNGTEANMFLALGIGDNSKYSAKLYSHTEAM